MYHSLSELISRLSETVSGLGGVLAWLIMFALAWSLVIAWVAWWLWGVNWTRARDALRHGGWIPVCLLIFVAALVWSRLAPRPLSLGFTNVPNFWWQLAATGLLAGGTLFLGWLQGAMGWTPPDYPIYPEGDDHGHGHAHDAHGHDTHGHDALAHNAGHGDAHPAAHGHH